MSCEVESKYSKLFYERANKELDLQSLLDNILEKAEKDINITITSVRWRFFFDWLISVADPGFWELKKSDFSVLFLWVNFGDIISDRYSY